MVRHIGNDGLHPPKTSGGLRRATAGKGHEDAFPRPRLSARCRFSQGTFAGTWGNGRDAPKAADRLCKNLLSSAT
jgi:hypothetical protein